MQMKSGSSFTVINKQGQVSATIAIPYDQDPHIFSEFLRFSLDSHANFIIAFVHHNFIKKIDEHSTELWSIHPIENMKQEYKTIAGFSLPQHIFYKDVELDNFGNIFVLSGQGKQDRGHEIFVLNTDGKPVGSLFLNESTHLIHIDRDNNLYSRGEMGARLIKYRLKYE
jgi:hypothetical protein